MLGQVDVALRRDRSPVEYRSTLAAFHEQAVRLQQIVEMLLFLTQRDTDVAPLAIERIELNTWLANHLTSWRQHPRYRDLQVDRNGAAPLWVDVHSGLLGQAFDNLLDNACKYSEPDSAIIVRTRAHEAESQLIVEDRGCGIAAADLPRIADPFFRSDEARRRGVIGTGLGLSVTHRIIGALSGRLCMESTEGIGSIFTIVFPLPASGQTADVKSSHRKPTPFSNPHV